MKTLQLRAALGAAAILFPSLCFAKHGHSHNLEHLAYKRHNHNHLHVEHTQDAVEKRDATCAFPTDAGLVPITPNMANGGWAMSPDQQCLPGSFCPFACPSGQVMAQWNPAATSYIYPLSMDGGLFCGLGGQVSKPFPNKPYCVDGTNTVGAENLCSGVVSFCQTVLPGNEAMLIPTAVESWAQLAVPAVTYWASTAAHYYVNSPGLTVDEACVWGDGSKALGNWAAYVAGANTDASGNTYVKLGWNPIFTGSPLSSTPPNFGLKIECSGSGCNGLPCSIDPSVDGVGGVTSSDQASGAGGANFCVVTVPAGLTANIVVFPAGDSSGGSGSPGSASSSEAAATPTPTPTPTPTSPSTSSSTTSTSTSTSTSASTSTTAPSAVISDSSSATDASSATSDAPHILFQSGNSTTNTVLSTGTGTATGTTIPTTSNALTSPIATQTHPSAASGNLVSSGALYLTGAIAAVAALL